MCWGHQVFCATSALDRERWNIGDHVNGDSTNAELSRRTINSVNQLSVYGAVADWCEELAQQMTAQASSSIGKPTAQVNEQLDSPLAAEDVSAIMTSLETNVSGDKISLPAGLGGGKGGTKLPRDPGHGVPGNVRTGKETWLVRVLNEPVGWTTSSLWVEPVCLSLSNCVAVGTFCAWTGWGLSFILLCLFVVVSNQKVERWTCPSSEEFLSAEKLRWVVFVPTACAEKWC